MDFSGTNTVFAITTICYTIGMVANCFPKICEDCIPIVMSVTSALLGIAGMFLIKDFPAQDIINAIAVGIASDFQQREFIKWGNRQNKQKDETQDRKNEYGRN